jgi:hypothetical protein
VPLSFELPLQDLFDLVFLDVGVDERGDDSPVFVCHLLDRFKLAQLVLIAEGSSRR